MKKILSSLVMFSMVLSSVASLPLKALAVEVDQIDQVCTQNDRLVVVSDTTTEEDGSPSFVVSNPHERWTASISGASSIWGEDPTSAANALGGVTQTFTKTFNISGTPTEAILDVAADNVYTVYVNGVEIYSDLDENPAEGSHNYQAGGQDDSIPVTNLVSGDNEIKFEVKNSAMAEGTPENNPGGLMYKLKVDSETCDDGDQDPETATLEAKKIVCPLESDLPNWGVPSTHVITADTADQYVIDHPTCEIVPWTFEWSLHSNPNVPDDNQQVGGEGWTTFTSSTQIPVGPEVWAREQMPAGYIPFSGYDPEDEENYSDVSAEFYCNTDVASYDNVDMVGWSESPLVEGETYHCVGFNVAVRDTTPSSCDAEANLLTNGDFEDTEVTNSALWDIFPSGVISWIAEWNSPSGAPEIANIEVQEDGLAGWSATSAGGQWSELDSDYDGPDGPLSGQSSVAISQDVATVNGENYNVSFDFSARPDTDAAQNVVEVLADNVLIGTAGPTAGAANTAWVPYSFNFKATGSTTTITLRDAGTPNDSLGSFVDNASVKCVKGEETSDEVDVTVAKYIQSGEVTVHASEENTDGATFPIDVTWDSSSIGSGSGSLVLGPEHPYSPNPYESLESELVAGDDFTVEETIGTECNANNVGQYVLVGYKIGDTVEGALASATVGAAELTNIQSDKVIIVVNKKCGEPENPPTTSTINATKIVCPTENLLPNWGNGTVVTSITSTTASDFITAHPTCHLEPWTFEWAPSAAVNPGDQIGVAGGTWTAFTGGTTSIPTPSSPAQVWVREQASVNYIPFSGDITAPRDQDVSAELYCSVDVLNYDNYDRVDNMVVGGTYNCVAFNVPKVTPPTDVCPNIEDNQSEVPGGMHKDEAGNCVDDGDGDNDPTPTQCNDNIDNSDSEDELADELDPGCWTDPNDSNTYDSNDNDETNPTDVCLDLDGIQTNESQCDDGGGNPQCSDGVDNDGDENIDEDDAGCIGGGDQYDPNDNDESNSTDSTDDTTKKTSSSRHGSGSNNNSIGGEVLGAETSCGIYVDKFLRKGYKNNMDAVKKVQQFLNDYTQANLTVDGVYGGKTETSVKAFQVAHGDKILTPWGINLPTGIFYLTTQTEVNNIMCPTLGLPIPSNLVNFTPAVIAQ